MLLSNERCVLLFLPNLKALYDPVVVLECYHRFSHNGYLTTLFGCYLRKRSETRERKMEMEENSYFLIFCPFYFLAKQGKLEGE